MDQRNERTYYVARAEAARALAAKATSPAIAAIHEEIAARYEFILAQDGSAATRIDGDAASV